MGVQLPRPEQPSAPLMPALRYDVSRCQNLTSPREGARRMTGGRPFSDSLLRGIAPREADIRLTTLLWPSALACLSAKSRRRARAQTGPSCAVDDPNEDGDSDYCEGSDDRGSSGPNAVFAAALLTSNSTLRTIANAGISPSTETPRPPASLNFAEPVASSVGAFRSAMLNSEKRDRVLRR